MIRKYHNHKPRQPLGTTRKSCSTITRHQAEGYATWIDIEKMGGSTLEGMAAAVENSAVVLVCLCDVSG